MANHACVGHSGHLPPGVIARAGPALRKYPVSMRARWSACSRLAAAALAVLLSGAPRLAVGRTAVAATCHCRRDRAAAPCACPKHRAQGSSAPQHGPRCHGQGQALPARDARPARVAGSCLDVCCGGSEDRAAQPSGTDFFTVPERVGISRVTAAEPVAIASAGALDRGREPDVPPPRAG